MKNYGSVNFLCENNRIIELIGSPLLFLFFIESIKYYLDYDDSVRTIEFLSVSHF